MLIIGIIVIYVYFVNDWGQKFMKSRQAYDLSNIIQIYNLAQIFINLYIGLYVSKLNINATIVTVQLKINFNWQWHYFINYSFAYKSIKKPE